MSALVSDIGNQQRGAWHQASYLVQVVGVGHDPPLGRVTVFAVRDPRQRVAIAHDPHTIGGKGPRRRVLLLEIFVVTRFAQRQIDDGANRDAVFREKQRQTLVEALDDAVEDDVAPLETYFWRPPFLRRRVLQ